MLRFFPLVPMLAKPFIWVGIPAKAAVLIVSNISALVAGVLVYMLARREGRDAAFATRAAWFLALAPAAFVLVMGYTEGTTLALAIGVFLALRSKRWWVAAGLGVLAGLTRPSGFLLALPALIEAARGFRGLPVKAVRRPRRGRRRARGRHPALPAVGRQPVRGHVAAVLDPDRGRPAGLVHQPGRHDR